MITESYINKLIEQYAKSPAGKAAIKKETGLIYTDKDPSAMLMQYGEQMKVILYQRINPLIKSITLDDLVVRKPYEGSDALWRIDISFKEGSLERDSLSLDEYDGQGRPRENRLYNIVLLFAKGYHATKNGGYVYGWWVDKYGTHGDVRSRKDREGNDFLVQAVNEFNNGLGKDIARAELLGDYKDCSES